MRILLTHRFFWPDTPPYASILRSIGEDLAEAGHDVRIFASRPSYRGAGAAPAHERLGRLDVRRVWVFAEKRDNPALRVANVALYCGALFAHVLRLRPNLVSASTFPPVAAAWTASLAARLTGARFIYHVQDVHPEVSAYGGGRLGRGLPARLLRWLDNQTLRRASAVVVLSEDMADTLRARKAGDLPIRIINNFALDAFDRDAPPPAELAKPADRRRVIFAGNLGRFQNLPLLAEGIALCLDRRPELELLFIGDGAAEAELKARWGEHPQVRFGPFLPFAEARKLIAEADVGLVSLMPGMYRVAYPSKVLTYLGLGVPVLALVEPESALARGLRAEGAGEVPAAPTAEAIDAALETLLAAPGRLAAARASARRYYATRAGRAPVLRRWRALVGQLEASRSHPGAPAEAGLESK